MKFSHSLQFNAVPEWSSKYIAYTTLKKLIYSLQRDNLRRTYQQDDEEATLEGSHLIGANYASTGQTQDESASAVFIAALDAELKKIDTFYQQQEGFIFSNMNDLMNDIDNFEREVDESLALPGSNKNFQGVVKQNRRVSGSSQDNYITNTTDPDTEFTQPEDDDDDDDEEDALTSAFQETRGREGEDQCQNFMKMNINCVIHDL